MGHGIRADRAAAQPADRQEGVGIVTEMAAGLVHAGGAGGCSVLRPQLQPPYVPGPLEVESSGYIWWNQQ
ncbi:hypothetical protein D9M71_669420 [compost metagenome]